MEMGKSPSHLVLCLRSGSGAFPFSSSRQNLWTPNLSATWVYGPQAQARGRCKDFMVLPFGLCVWVRANVDVCIPEVVEIWAWGPAWVPVVVVVREPMHRVGTVLHHILWGLDDVGASAAAAHPLLWLGVWQPLRCPTFGFGL